MLPQNLQTELTNRHKAASITVASLLIATVLLSVVAYLGRPYFRQQGDSLIDVAVRIVVFVLALGAILWRRTKFAPMRLQDIGSLRGSQGLLKTLERTTVQVALLAAGITACGFIATLTSGSDLYTYWSALISVVLLIYGYPRKAAWSNALLRYSSDLNETPSEPVES